MRIALSLLIIGFIFGMTSPIFAQESPRGGQPYNPEISLDGIFSGAVFSDPAPLQFGGHDPNKRGFILEALELTFASNIDPYFRGEAHLHFGLDKGKSFVEVEEGTLTTRALPYGLQIIGGQFFTPFGRQNPRHPHAWDFADQTIVNTLMFGPDGLRNPGVEISALLPLPFYLEAIGSIQNAEGETATSFLFTPNESFAGRKVIARDIKSPRDLLYTGRIKTSVDLSETVSLVAGTSALFGPNGTGINTDTRIYGVDLFMKWKPISADHGWPFVTLQAEAMQRTYEAGEGGDTILMPHEVFKNDGSYIQSLVGFTRRWVAGLRYEQADATHPLDPRTGKRTRASSNLTFYPSEFSKIRLQYNNDKSAERDKAIQALFVQYEFLMGAHGAHTF